MTAYLPNGPRSMRVHGAVRSTRVRKLSGNLLCETGDIVRSVHRLNRNALENGA